MKISRRTFLKLIGGAGVAVPTLIHAAPSAPSAKLRRLEERITTLLIGENIGFDLRAVSFEDGYEFFRITQNAYTLYPVASCFKSLAVLYYLWYTPRESWQLEDESAAFRVAVYSNNPLTGDLIQETAQYAWHQGNAIEKFNNFVQEILLISAGIYRWNWAGSPTGETTDERFAPSLDSRFVARDGARFEMDNLYTPNALSDFYLRLLQRGRFDAVHPQAQDAVDTTRWLLSLQAEEYRSFIERAWGEYIGKDGVIPAEDSPVGRVTNDAGIVQVGSGTYILSAMYTNGEFRFLELLRSVFDALGEYEGL